MTDRDSRIDGRLREALTVLGDAAARKVAPVDVATVSTAGRRRRRARRAATATLAVLLAGGVPTGGWLVAGSNAPFTGDERAGSSGCDPAQAVAFLPVDTTDELRVRTGAVLADSPEVESPEYESKESAYRRFTALYSGQPNVVDSVRPETLPESWRFTLRCSRDWPAVRDRLGALPGLAVVCACAPGEVVPVPTPTATRTG
jgi:hypothetical protein